MAITAQYREKMIKLVEKEKKKKTAEELVKKAEKAFGNSKLIEIVQDVSHDNKVNLTKAYNQVFEFIFRATKDLQLAKEFAVSARWMAMLKRDYPDIFQKGIDVQRFSEGFQEETGEQKPEPKPEPKDVEIGLCGDIILKGGNFTTYSLRIKGIDVPRQATIMAGKFLEAATDVVYKNDNGEFVYAFDTLRDYLIQILEEKFGLTIKTCISCKHFSVAENRHFGKLCTHCSAVDGLDYQLDDYIETVFFSRFCKEFSNLEDKWTLKEIPSEKK